MMHPLRGDRTRWEREQGVAAQVCSCATTAERVAFPALAEQAWVAECMYVLWLVVLLVGWCNLQCVNWARRQGSVPSCPSVLSRIFFVLEAVSQLLVSIYSKCLTLYSCCTVLLYT